MSKEAMKLALEAAYLAGFNDSAEGYNGEYPFRDHGATPTKDRHWVERRDAHIREALAEQPEQPQQKPVKAMHIGFDWLDNKQLVATYAVPVATNLYAPDLYTSPPAQRTWIGLTDEDIKEAGWLLSAIKQYEAYTLDELLTVEGVDAFARAIEAKLKEKNT